MRSRLTILLLFIFYQSGIAQPYGNEWIDYSKTHYKIKVADDGMYRIPYSTLSNYISNLSSLTGSNFILFRNGVIIPIYITTSGSLTATDYIEFYGRKNDGEIDTRLFENPAWQLNTEKSLFTDTAIYFLSWNNSPGNPRINNFINDLTNLPPKETYFWHSSQIVYNSNFSSGRPYNDFGSSLYNSIFDIGEGFIGADYTNVQSHNLATQHIHLGGPSNANVRTVVVSKSTQDHHLRWSLNSNVLKDTSFSGYKLHKFKLTVPVSNLSASNTFTYEALAATVDRNAVSLIEIEYPRQFNFGGQSTFHFQLAGNASTRKYIEISNFDDQSTQPVIYDLTNRLRITSSDPPGTSPVRFALPISANEREVFVRSSDVSSVRMVTQMQQRTFTNLGSAVNQGDYIIISEASLLDDGAGGNPVEAYRQYRDQLSNPLASYTARTVLIDELYDQFAYGITKHPLSIRNFAGYALNNWSIQPEYFFLIGKGREYIDSRWSASGYHQSLIPTYGHPGSDNLLTASSGSNVPAIAIGRLAAENANSVSIYLDKVQTYEGEQAKSGDFFQTIDEKAWMKQFLHFGGGTGLFEQETFRNFLISYQKKVEGISYGAVVDSFYKRSSTPIATLQSDVIKSKIDDGVSVITFFGHSSPGSFDISFDEPENYTNFGKYPVILSNGCFSGYIFGTSKGISERFVFAEDKGGIAFLATTGLSLSSSLHTFATLFYDNFNNTHYGSTLGKFVQETSENIETSYPSTYNIFVAHEMTLHGDPALKLNNYQIPDYAIEPDMIRFEPQVVNSSSDSFNVHVVITNLGRAVSDSINVSMTRILENGNQVFYSKRIIGPPYKATITFRVPTIIDDPGFSQELINTINRFSFFVDSDNEVNPELSETNNSLPNLYFPDEISLNIITDDIFPVYPYEYSIVPSTDLILKASTSNAFAAERWYVFEMDTTESFNSSAKQSTRIFQSGGVVNWPVSVMAQDSLVYYWRVSKDSLSPGQMYSWHYSSFIYIDGASPGWNQSHYHQFLKDDYANTYLDDDRIFKYVDDVKEIEVTTGLGASAGGSLPDNELGWKLNGALQHRWRMGGCGGTFGITVAVLDGGTGLPWASINTGPTHYGQYGNYHCNYQYFQQYGFNFRTTGIHPELNIPWSEVITNFLDSIPAGDFILIYSLNNPNYPAWDADLVNAFIDLGVVSILPLSQGSFPAAPLIFFTEIGNAAYPSVEKVGTSMSDIITETIIFSGVWNEGFISSPLIGPALQWTSLHWDYESLEPTSDDIQRVDIYGVKTNGVENKIASVQFAKDTVLGFVHSPTYPYLRLQYHTKDNVTRTPAQLKFWRVLYQDVPDAAINPFLHFSFSGDTIEQGKLMALEVAAENITPVHMDSLLVGYGILDASNNAVDKSVRNDSLRANDTIHLTYENETVEFKFIGDNVLIVELNPANDQLEKHHFNNIGILNYKVTGDITNPLLDITFDGIHILDGDIVSAKPVISILLSDENQFLALDDTAAFKIQIKNPGGQLSDVYFTDDQVQFFPADPSNLAAENKAKIEVRREFEEDGTYELIIYDQDKSGNTSSSGKLAYRISFEVITKPGITNVLNYPNPFTTSTQFVFTLTGSTLPTYFKIQIMTIKGKVVREITQDELGPIHIGRNITEFTWNGTDQYGDPLGNGVYFYRVVTDLNGAELDHINTSADQYFKKGFGKMVLIR